MRDMYVISFIFSEGVFCIEEKEKITTDISRKKVDEIQGWTKG